MTGQFQRLLEVLLPHGGGVMVMLEGYFDESGDFDESPKVFCLSGYFLTADAAQAMDTAWGEVLDRYGLPFFHMVDCAHGRPPFAHLTRQQQIDVEKELIGLIKAHTLEGFSIVANGDFFEPTQQDPDLYSSCVSGCVLALNQFLTQHRLDGGLAYFFETGHKNKGRAYNHVAAKIQQMGASLTFADKTKVRLLQAADLLAWQTTKYVKDKLSGARPPRKDFLSLMEHDHMFMHITIRREGKESGFEAWPLSRRSPTTAALSINTSGPINYLVEEGEGVPIIPVQGSIGWRLGGGRMAYVKFEAIGDKPFALAFDEMRLVEAIITLIGTTELYKERIERPIIATKGIGITTAGNKPVLVVELLSGLSLAFDVPESVAEKLKDALATTADASKEPLS